MLSDLLAANRRLLEEVLGRLRRMDAETASHAMQRGQAIEGIHSHWGGTGGGRAPKRTRCDASRRQRLRQVRNDQPGRARPHARLSRGGDQPLRADQGGDRASKWDAEKADLRSTSSRTHLGLAGSLSPTRTCARSTPGSIDSWSRSVRRCTSCPSTTAVSTTSCVPRCWSTWTTHRPRTLPKSLESPRRAVILSTPREPLWRLLNVARGRYWRDFGNTPGHVQHFSRCKLEVLARQELEILDRRSPPPWTVLLGRPLRSGQGPAQGEGLLDHQR